MSDLNKKIDSLQKIRAKEVHSKYIEYIRYPRFRNLEENSQINFNFPITFLVGKNGGGKSSTLQSLYGCPKDYSLGDYWFTTELDPIKELKEDRNCFIYAYKTGTEYREVLKQRGKRDKNPDYWETSRPVVKYKMVSDRNSPIEKNVEYIDFRSELSAFDKYLYFSKFNSGKWYNKKQDFLRAKSKKLKKALDRNKILTYRNQQKNKKKIDLSLEEISIINKILGKHYSEIEIIEHNWFDNWGFSIRLNSDHLNYSEAFAGSGETAIVMLVHKIFNASNETLILLDEPETSLHSGAQKRLMEFLLDQCIQKKHQVIISTHSPFLIENMPDDAIKVFSTITSTGKFIINNKRSYKEAFHELEIENTNRKTIIVEDKTAKLLIDKVLEKLGAATQEIFDVKYLPGGADDINQRLSTIMELSNDTFVIFDGDQKKLETKIDLSTLPANQQDSSDKLKKLIKQQTGCDIKFYLDGGNQEKEQREKQILNLSIKYLDFYKHNVYYLPLDIPEDIIWDEAFATNLLGLIQPSKSISVILDKSSNSKELLFNFCIECYDSSSHYESTLVLFITNWLNKSDSNYQSIIDIIDKIK